MLNRGALVLSLALVWSRMCDEADSMPAPFSRELFLTKPLLEGKQIYTRTHCSVYQLTVTRKSGFKTADTTYNYRELTTSQVSDIYANLNTTKANKSGRIWTSRCVDILWTHSF